jgi:hypothetical protein
MGDKELDDQGALHVSAPQSTLLQSANGDRLLAAPSRPRAPAGDDDCRNSIVVAATSAVVAAWAFA